MEALANPSPFPSPWTERGPVFHASEGAAQGMGDSLEITKAHNAGGDKPLPYLS